MTHTIGDLSTDGISVTDALPSVGVYAPSAYTVIAVTRGCARVCVCGTPYELSSDTLLLLQRGDICHIPVPSLAPDCRTFSFTQAALYGDPAQLMKPFSGERYRTAETMPPALLAHLGRFGQLSLAPSESAVPLARMMLSEMLLYLTEAPLDAAPPCGMARVAAYLTSHAYEEISLDRLSEEVGISKFHLCRAFRRDSGLTPHAYLGYLRVLRAQELLMQGLPAQEVGEAVGFRDYSTFFRTYKKMLGRAPTSPEGEEADK